MISIAIDGPVGAGKSTLARTVAEKLNYIYVDTGALYRAVGLYFTQFNVSTANPVAIKEALAKINLEINRINGVQHIILNGDDVSEDIRAPQASMMASTVSALPAVRDFLLSAQVDIAKIANVIMDGRDIGTVVLPNADVKIFITAHPRVRAMRRFAELEGKGMHVKFDDVLADLKQRDYQDMNRKISPLKQAADAVLLDTTELNFQQSADKIIEIIYNKVKDRLIDEDDDDEEIDKRYQNDQFSEENVARNEQKNNA